MLLTVTVLSASTQERIINRAVRISDTEKLMTIEDYIKSKFTHCPDVIISSVKSDQSARGVDFSEVLDASMGEYLDAISDETPKKIIATVVTVKIEDDDEVAAASTSVGGNLTSCCANSGVAESNVKTEDDAGINDDQDVELEMQNDEEKVPNRGGVAHLADNGHEVEMKGQSDAKSPAAGDISTKERYDERDGLGANDYETEPPTADADYGHVVETEDQSDIISPAAGAVSSKKEPDRSGTSTSDIAADDFETGSPAAVSNENEIEMNARNLEVDKKQDFARDAEIESATDTAYKASADDAEFSVKEIRTPKKKSALNLQDSHREVDPESVRKNSTTVEQPKLRASVESYRTKPEQSKPFTEMTAEERDEYWSDNNNLEAFFAKVKNIKHGAFCSVCESHACYDEQCGKCGAFFHDGCVGISGKCYGCQYLDKKAGSSDYTTPICKMCHESQGPLLKMSAKPMSMRKWRGNKDKKAVFDQSLFGPNNYCHVLCGFWNPDAVTIEGEDTIIDTTNIVMSHGQGFHLGKQPCLVCGLKSGAKVHCSMEGCTEGVMHVTCARAAGFEVNHRDDKGFYIHCFHHSENGNNLRARLENLLELEVDRSPKKHLDKYCRLPMTWNHAAALYHAAVNVLRVLGWAWRWAEWWVSKGDNWEPLLEDDQIEDEMTDEELKIVPSSPESRCEDARKSHLVAFGAALRNRDFDEVEGINDQTLEQAIRAVLGIPSLVGPLQENEIKFIVTWLSLAYRSNSPLLGFGNDKIPVTEMYPCLTYGNGTPKYELGSRPLPWKVKPDHASPSFHPNIERIDDGSSDSFFSEFKTGAPTAEGGSGKDNREEDGDSVTEQHSDEIKESHLITPTGAATAVSQSPQSVPRVLTMQFYLAKQPHQNNTHNMGDRSIEDITENTMGKKRCSVCLNFDCIASNNKKRCPNP